jgi:hypothetical protein
MMFSAHDILCAPSFLASCLLSFLASFPSLLPTMSYTIPEMSWPVVTKKDPFVLLSEKYGTTCGHLDLRWDLRWDLGIGKNAEIYVQKLLASYKVPVYHISVDQIMDMGYTRKSRHRVPYIDFRYIYIWTFSAPKKPVVHIYYQNGNKDSVCSYEKTVDAELLTGEDAFDCEDIIARMLEL